MTQVLDTSVLLAGLLGEVGGDVLDRPGQVFHMSAVNLGEVYSKVLERGGATVDVDSFLQPLPLCIDPFDGELARMVGELRPVTRRFGLSFGDRACLALAMRSNLSVLTGDRAWLTLGLDLDIRLIR